jgi:RNA polymerase sigma-70 factor (ECF subfamily)
VTRGRLGTGLGGTSVIDWLENHPAPDDEARDVDEEFRRALFRHAAEKIRPEFRDSTWQAFWLTAVEGLSVDDAARQLGKSVGVIYTGRSRVMRRLREAVREIEEAGS